MTLLRRSLPLLAVVVVLALSWFAPSPTATFDLSKCHGYSYSGYSYGHCK